MHLIWKIRGDLNPEMHLITGNFLVAIQDQPIADLSAHTLVLIPILCDIRLLGRPRRTKKERFDGTNAKELLKAMFLDTAGSNSNPAHISAADAQCLGSSRCLGGLADEQTRLEGKKF